MNAVKQVLKWSVPVDDQDHPIGTGRVVHVACQSGVVDVVSVWTEETAHTYGQSRRARAYGTGQPIPEDDEHIGTALAPVHPPKTLVWHIYGGTR